MCQNIEDEKYELYSIGECEENRYGNKETETKSAYGENFRLISKFENLDCSIVDFAATMHSSYVITKK